MTPGQTKDRAGKVSSSENPHPPAEVRVLAGLEESLYARATAITCQAYFFRLSSVACSDENTMAYFRWRLMRRLRDGVALGAYSENDLVGLALLRPGGHPRTEGFPFFQRILSRILLAPVNKGDYVLDSLSVDTPWRVQGIGSLLLDASIAHVRDQGASTLRLEVAASNDAAVDFFTAKGFAIMKALGYRLFLRLLGHARMYTMTMELG
jgi:ribosomal protein S18 acetylase RimI-like enzyme